MSDSFNVRWSQKLDLISERVLPWERQFLPPVPKEPSEKQLVAFLNTARPLIDRGRWWYFCMTPIRLIRAVISNIIVKIFLVVVLLLYMAHYFLFSVVLVHGPPVFEQLVEDFTQEQFPELYNLQKQLQEVSVCLSHDSQPIDLAK